MRSSTCLELFNRTRNCNCYVIVIEFVIVTIKNPIHKTAATQLSFCSCVASRHINFQKYAHSCTHDSHIY